MTLNSSINPLLNDLELRYKSLIIYPQMVELIEMMLDCLEDTELTGEPHCMSLEAYTGAGKSRLMRVFGNVVEHMPQYRDSKDAFLYVVVPKPARIKAVASAMLRALKDPSPERGTEWSMNARILDQIEEKGVRSVGLDDAQHLLDPTSGVPLYEVTDWLKYIIKAPEEERDHHPINCYLFGTPNKVNKLILENEQLSRLFALREKLHPFKWNPKDQDTIVKLATFIEVAEEKHNIKLADQLPRIELLSRVHYATQGYVGNMINLLRLSTRYPLRTTQFEISLAALSWAYKKRLQKHLRLPHDPFDPKWGKKFKYEPLRKKGNTNSGITPDKT
jgi:hypothetical protein